MVRMHEYRNVWVDASSEEEARRLVEEEDWFGPEFPCDAQLIDAEFGAVESVEVAR